MNCESVSSVTSFEHLSNELIYEIFDYLDFYSIHKSFLNLNIRFYNLINSSTLPIKINLSSISKSNFQLYYEHIIIPYQNRITLLQLSNRFISDLFSVPFNNMIQLQTLVLKNIESDFLENIFTDSLCLPSLSSLVIKPIDTLLNTNNLYRQIFRLPALKYCNVTFNEAIVFDPLPFATNKEFSSIEIFLINHGCRIDQLNAILSYVPHIRRISCNILPEFRHHQISLRSVELNNLTHLSLTMNHLLFDQIKLLIKIFFNYIQVFHIITNDSLSYSDINQWEQIILSYLPNLRIFHVKLLSDQPKYLFWFNRQWHNETLKTFSHSFYSIQSINIPIILHQLIDLPRLYSLTIQTEEKLKTFGKIYQLVFNLPNLKYFQCRAEESTDSNINKSLPIALSQQITSIKQLIINHPCNFKQLIHLLSYTPKLQYLEYLNLNDNITNLNILSSIQLLNLTSLSIRSSHTMFDTLEIYLDQFEFNLKIFSIDIHIYDQNYLNAQRWELILQRNFPQLEEFYMKYTNNFDDNHQPLLYTGQSNEFSSLFWIQRQWLLDIKIEFDCITYSIHPYKKRWFEYNEQERIDLYKSKQLILNDVSPERSYQTLTIHHYIKQVKSVTHIDHLSINTQIFVIKLIEILQLLPELDSLKLSSKISFQKPRKVHHNELLNIFCSINRINITKLYLEKIRQMKDISFFLTICPLIKQIHINNLYKINIQSFLRLILTQIKNQLRFQNLRLLSIRLPIIDDKIIFKLKQIIQNEYLLNDYTIKRIEEIVFLEWK
ncbi:unnamed protein product [Adineta steineri]|uniref:F-box domain-containing protein n=2 Tax=Adineta steineri TaxID=433720 RepID=A0A813WQL6_9BILA|nr:unnamed protein product [Adineta steineri]